MSGTVSLSVIEGPAKGETFRFSERSVAIAGRAEDCHPQIVETGQRALVSRHHCLFDVNPPDIRVRDFGSLNGTYVNDVSIGQREKGQSPEEGARLAFREQDLRDGDLVKLGGTVLRVDIERAILNTGEGESLCGNCGRTFRVLMVPDHERLCESCRAEPEDALDELLNEAAGGDPDLEGIVDYDIVRELGRGGQGRVYLVRHRATGNFEALKLLLAEVSVEEKARDDFLREIANIQALHHPNIVGFRQAGSSGGKFYFTTEFCEGGSVQDLVVARRRPLPIDEAVDIAVQALEGLAYAHNVFLGADARGLVHRDIKPANLLLAGTEGNRIAKVGDFGLAKAFDRAGLSGHTMTGSAAGTVSFMARKQLINYKYAKPDVDVWSMAASLYWMLTTRAPRHIPADSDPFLAVLHETAVPIRDRNPGIPKPLADIIDEALVEKPASSINTATDLADALRSVT
jgi:hypothetical protein